MWGDDAKSSRWLRRALATPQLERWQTISVPIYIASHEACQAHPDH
jgi:hypothetical protein